MKACRRVTALAALLAAGSTPAFADWLRAESPNFIVYSKGSEARLREQVLLLEDFDRLLRVLTTAGPEPAVSKLHVYIVRGNRELQVVNPVGRDAAGFYVSSPHGIAAFVDSRASMGKHEVLLHEYVHHFMHQYAPGSYPAWYVEGFAEYFMTTEFDARHIEYAKHSRYRAGWLLERDWLPMDRVLFGTTSGLSRVDTERFYAQSWLATHYFSSTDERIDALRRYFTAVLAGVDRRDAFEAETGFTAEQFTAELRAYIGNRRIISKRFPRQSVEAPPAITVTPMPRSANDLMLYEAVLRVGISEDRRETVLDLIRKAAMRHGSDAFARRVLAHAEAVYGDPATADELLDGLLAAGAEDAELLYLKGMRHYAAAEGRDDSANEMRVARQWFVRAHQADENHFPTLYRYAQSLSDEAGYTSENTANVLLLAHDLAPQVMEIRIAAADVLMRREDYSQAQAILAPLATHPHYDELAEWARRQIARAEARELMEIDEP